MRIYTMVDSPESHKNYYESLHGDYKQTLKSGMESGSGAYLSMRRGSGLSLRSNGQWKGYEHRSKINDISGKNSRRSQKVRSYDAPMVGDTEESDHGLSAVSYEVSRRNGSNSNIEGIELTTMVSELQSRTKYLRRYLYNKYGFGLAGLVLGIMNGVAVSMDEARDLLQGKTIVDWNKDDADTLRDYIKDVLRLYSMDNKEARSMMRSYLFVSVFNNN